jgi:hypothetical protein
MVDSVGRSGGTPLPGTWNGDTAENTGTQGLTGPKLICDPEDSLTGPQGDAGDWSDGAALLVAETTSASRQSAPTHNNAQRSATVVADLGYADAGFTSAHDSVFAGVAAFKGQQAGGTFEIWSESAQVGAQNEVQAGVARAAVGFGDATTCELRAVEGELHLGIHNPDGSAGVNGGGGLSGVTVECTVTRSGNSLTLGLSASLSQELSIGVRDSDADGREEYCARIAKGPLVVGACVELESAAELVRDFYDQVSSGLSR